MERPLRALRLLGLAAAAVAVVGVLYLRPSVGLPAPTPSLSPSPRVSATRLWPVVASFADAEHGFVVVDASQPNGLAAGTTTLLTRDGGQTWKPLPAGVIPFLGMWFAGSSLLVVNAGQSAGASSLAGAIQLSDDGGRSWRSLQLPQPAIPPGAGFTRIMTFIDAHNGWVLANVFAQGSSATTATSPELWRTTDGGTTWSRLRASGTFNSAGVLDMRFVDARHGVLAVQRPGATPLLLATQDGGESWQQVAALDVPEPKSGSAQFTVSLISEGTRVLAVLSVTSAAGPIASARPDTGQTIGARVDVYTMASDDAGGTWSALRQGPTAVDPAGRFAGPATEAIGWLAVLDGTRLWTSTDGGTAWTVRATEFPKGLVPLVPVTGDQHAMFVLATPADPAGNPLTGAPLALLRSVDAGAHWKPVVLPRRAGS